MTNNTNKIAVETTTANKMEYEPSYKFYSVLDDDSVLDVTVNHLKLAIINLIIANTAEAENISDNQLQYMTEYLKSMLKTGNVIKIIKNYDYEYEEIIIDDFNRITINQLSKLLDFVIQTRCWIQHYYRVRRHSNADKGFDFETKELKNQFSIRFKIPKSE